MSADNISMPASDPYAGFLRRVGAWFIDFLVIGVAYFLVAFYLWDDLIIKLTSESPDGEAMIHSFAPTLLGSFLLGVATWAYMALQESSRARATLGKRAFGIRVCDYNGERLGFIAASYRSWPLWLPGLINAVVILDLIVGLASLAACLSVAFTKRKQGLHDIMAGCLVIKRQAVFSDNPWSQ